MVTYKRGQLVATPRLPDGSVEEGQDKYEVIYQGLPADEVDILLDLLRKSFRYDPSQ